MSQLPSKTTYDFRRPHEGASPSRHDRLLEGISSALTQKAKQERLLFERQAHHDRILLVATIIAAAATTMSTVVALIILLR
jgi:hypothetical protein